MKRRPFIGLLFRCCNVYSRAYLNAAKTAYTASCPSCYERVRIAVSPKGSKNQFFSVG